MNMVTEKDALEKSPEGGLNFIEQLQISCDNPCTKNNRPFLVGVSDEKRKTLLIRPNCKTWACETCALRNARYWIAAIINGINELGGKWYFVTITSSRYRRGASSIRTIRAGWKKLYNRILALYGKDAKALYYVKVWEQHTDGSFHLHLLVNFPIKKRWLKDNAFQCNLGYSADVRPVHNAGQVAGYIAKYTLKNAHTIRGGVEFPKGIRRIETSHKWPKLPEILDTSDFSWIIKFSREAQLKSAKIYQFTGYTVLDFVDDKVI